MAAEAFLATRVELELPGAVTAAGQVADYLRRVVHRGELGPGDRLPAERELAVTLGVSRETLRQAMQVLEEQGYVVRRRGVTGGAFVTDLAVPFEDWRSRMAKDRAVLQELWDLRDAVEVQIARLASERRTATDLKELDATQAELRECQTRADFRRCDLSFHGGLASAARSPKLAGMMYATRGELFSPVEPTVVPARVRLAVDGHAIVVDAIRDRDVEAAGSAMRAHLAAARAEMLKALGLR
jgi:DNA-binding FadR family transcriptional regulator